MVNRYSQLSRYAEAQEVIQVITVATAEQHRLLLEFNTGEWRCFDMRP